MAPSASSGPLRILKPHHDRRFMKAIIVGFMLLGSTAAAVGDTSLRGYSNAAARTELDWEAKFRAVPEPARMRAAMQRLAARPHHVGSPYGKDNAEWLAAQFRSY